MVDCPVCSKSVKERDINAHLDSGCELHIFEEEKEERPTKVASFFSSQPPKRVANGPSTPPPRPPATQREYAREAKQPPSSVNGVKRQLDGHVSPEQPSPKKSRISTLEKVAPLADRMRPRSLDEVCGQELVGPNGVIRGLIEQDRVPSMVLWGYPGTGKTTIARVIAHTSNSRFVEINSTSSGVAECKKIFAQAMNELQLTGRKTIIFCDEIHRFSKSQQDVFLGPVEAGLITLIGATTENPSFKVISALLSRCRVFTLSLLTDEDVVQILRKAIDTEQLKEKQEEFLSHDDVLNYIATSSAGDARTALNLLELGISLADQPAMTFEKLKTSLTHTLIYDRQGDAHYDAISALHKSIRGSDPDASLYYLARMIESGEDPLYIARRLIVVASEDVGLADNTMLPLAIATHDAVQKIGLPEARINLGHCVTALALSPKSTRAYRGLASATAAVKDPATAGLPIPLHLRNAPTRLMKEIGYGAEYKYNPSYLNGKVKQEYMPDKLKGSTFLEDHDFGTEVDPDMTAVESQDTLVEEQRKGEDGNNGSTASDDLEPPDEAESMALDEDGAEQGDWADDNAEHRDGEEMWEQDEDGLWAVRKSSQPVPEDDDSS